MRTGHSHVILNGFEGGGRGNGKRQFAPSPCQDDSNRNTKRGATAPQKNWNNRAGSFHHLSATVGWPPRLKVSVNLAFLFFLSHPRARHNDNRNPYTQYRKVSKSPKLFHHGYTETHFSCISHSKFWHGIQCNHSDTFHIAFFFI